MQVYAGVRRPEGGAPYNQSIKHPRATQWALEHSPRAQGPVADKSVYIYICMHIYIRIYIYIYLGTLIV